MGWTKIDAIRIRSASDEQILRAIDDTTAAAAIYAKKNHPGWRNRTGTLESSVRIEPARKLGPSLSRGMFGSFDVNYAIFIEILHGHFLRNAADVEFPKIGARLRRAS